MLKRHLSQTLQSYLQHFPAVVLTGARQVGKTTFLREMLKGTHEYILLEDPDTRQFALEDPRGFLNQFKNPVIIDEFQYAPEIVSYLQGIIDNQRKVKGKFVLTGSQSFQMMNQVSQSLAGRCGVLSLYGLDSAEYNNLVSGYDRIQLSEYMLRGFYPELAATPSMSANIWYGSYVRTYLEKDIRNLMQVGDLGAFERFIKVLASRTGQVLNKSDVASDCGISVQTVDRWIALLERSYVVYLLKPYAGNLSSRVKKAPKIYFLDTGLAAYLMGFRDATTLAGAPQLGALFETLVVSDHIKKMAHIGEDVDFSYLQTAAKLGCDLIYEYQGVMYLIEIKSSQTFSSEFAESLIAFQKKIKNKKTSLRVLMPIEDTKKIKLDGVEVQVSSWSE